ncbi:ABZJ_00895 family protein [Tabrizicola sp.]|uniref:ABZJ_00895 family protein n=1 Tax=Tabrizicola sp. TaxID=2005166 RepID=UPI00286AD7CA|nr:ABZJ_00895 family protein [Tabrizicola sp.]
MDQTAYTTARRSYLGSIALAAALGMLVALVVPDLATSVALPLAFIAAQIAGARFASLATRPMTMAEASRIAAMAAAIQVALFLVGLVFALLTEDQGVAAIHGGTIALIGMAAAVIGFLVTLAGLRFGAFLELRRKSRKTGS